MEKVEYEPGESGVIKAFYNTGKNPGTFKKTIWVKSNSVKDNDLTLIMKGSVFAELDAKNTTLFFYDLQPGKTKIFSVKVIVNMKKPLEIKGWKITYPFNAHEFFNLKVKLEHFKGKIWYLKFYLTPKENVYQFRSQSLTVKVKTNSRQVPELAFFLRVRFKKPVVITPTALFMYSKENGQTAPATIEIETELKNGLNIESVSCKDCPLKFKVINISKRDKQILVLPDYTRGKKGKIFSGIIKLKIDAGGVKEYSIPVRGKLY